MSASPEMLGRDFDSVMPEVLGAEVKQAADLENMKREVLEGIAKLPGTAEVFGAKFLNPVEDDGSDPTNSVKGGDFVPDGASG